MSSQHTTRVLQCRPLAALRLGVGAVLLLAACSDAAEAPLAPRARAVAAVGAATGAGAGATAQPADRCVNVEADGVATLGFPVTLPNGTTGAGGTWTPVTLGGIAGELASVLVSDGGSGASTRGARHWVLEHAFRTAGGDWFVTRDRAVCAPAGADPTTCRVNDALTIVDGTGIFANARGSLRNHGAIDLAGGTLAYAIRGRVCGDGL